MPMEPILMYPAYRHGSQTPWGGDRLRALYGKPIPDERTGEALEISAIPGLNSRDPNGTPLDELIRLHGKALTGLEPDQPFPLLLKLLCAKDKLSVQVHPDDAYAAREGKLGKTEAWVILEAEPDAELVYGVVPGITRETLEVTLRQGAPLAPLLRRVKVRAGEVYSIPAGMVHAIGAGITLYEIQQSSDITYRFYDWDRVDAAGKRRELHIRQALDVTDTALVLSAAQPSNRREYPHGDVETLLSGGKFRLERARVRGALPVPRGEGVFAFLTALDPLCLGALALPAGQSVLLPADSGLLTLTGHGTALVAWPT